MKLTLYYAPITCALAPYITLTEAGADFDVHPVNLRKGEHRSPKYLKLNPKHHVPTLLIDGEPLTRTPRSRFGLRAISRRRSSCPTTLCSM
jgi:glutathione S-transferase